MAKALILSALIGGMSPYLPFWRFDSVSQPVAVFVDCAAELDNSSLANIKADAQLIFLKVAEGDMTVTEV